MFTIIPTEQPVNGTLHGEQMPAKLGKCCGVCSVIRKSHDYTSLLQSSRGSSKNLHPNYCPPFSLASLAPARQAELTGGMCKARKLQSITAAPFYCVACISKSSALLNVNMTAQSHNTKTKLRESQVQRWGEAHGSACFGLPALVAFPAAFRVLPRAGSSMVTTLSPAGS